MMCAESNDYMFQQAALCKTVIRVVFYWYDILFVKIVSGKLQSLQNQINAYV